MLWRYLLVLETTTTMYSLKMRKYFHFIQHLLIPLFDYKWSRELEAIYHYAMLVTFARAIREAKMIYIYIWEQCKNKMLFIHFISSIPVCSSPNANATEYCIPWERWFSSGIFENWMCDIFILMNSLAGELASNSNQWTEWHKDGSRAAAAAAFRSVAADDEARGRRRTLAGPTDRWENAPRAA